MQFHDVGADRGRSLDRACVGLDEQRHADAGGLEIAHDARELGAAADDVETALGRALLAPLRHEAARRWERGASAMSSISSVAAISRLSGQVSSAFRRADVAVGDVPAILAQVRGDAVGAGLQRKVRGAQRIGMASAARVTDGGHVIDVHAQAQIGKRARLTHAGTDPD